MRSGHFSLSEQVFQRMIQEATVDRSDVRLAMAYGNMGNLMKRQKKFESALAYYAASDAIC